MKKTFISVLTIFIGLALVSSIAFPWGSATHAYIADHLGQVGLLNLYEIYGAMVPDMFNYAFDLPPAVQLFLHDLTHGQPNDESFMAVWNYGSTMDEKSVGYGFVCHNDVWAADYTAHHQASKKKKKEGYVIFKAQKLNKKLRTHPEYGELYRSLGLPDEVAEEVCHNLVETAGDILIKREDPQIGQKVMDSAFIRPAWCVNFLVDAYGLSGSMYAIIFGLVEPEFRSNMLGYGWVLLNLNEEAAISALGAQLANLAVIYLATKGITIDLEDAMILADVGLREAMKLCMNDYMKEIDSTIDFVDEELVDHEINY
ncbi:MAG: hypothetical protein GTO17_11535 [Candidatus Aminicenantes bacterium]|nr:hypothetical protein [Candidatus Aminicenantes bacterium]